MNIQIFGKSKCFDTKKAERYFKERGIKFQFIDILSKGMSKGEFNSISVAVGGYENLIDTFSKAYKDSIMQYLAYEKDKIEKLLETPAMFKTPVVRNGRQATVQTRSHTHRISRKGGKRVYIHEHRQYTRHTDAIRYRNPDHQQEKETYH